MEEERKVEKQSIRIYKKKFKKMYSCKIGLSPNFRSIFNAEIHTDLLYLEDVEVWSGKIEYPPLQISEKLHINELSETFTISDRARNTDGGYIYWVDEPEIIEDEESKFSHEQAEKQYMGYEELRIELKEKYRGRYEKGSILNSLN